MQRRKKTERRYVNNMEQKKIEEKVREIIEKRFGKKDIERVL